MTLSQVYARLAGQRINGVRFTDGTELRCPNPALVEVAHENSNTIAEIWIGADEDGLTLHFNAASAPGVGLHVQEEPLISVADVF